MYKFNMKYTSFLIWITFISFIPLCLIPSTLDPQSKYVEEIEHPLALVHTNEVKLDRKGTEAIMNGVAERLKANNYPNTELINFLNSSLNAELDKNWSFNKVSIAGQIKQQLSEQTLNDKLYYAYDNYIVGWVYLSLLLIYILITIFTYVIIFSILLAYYIDKYMAI